MPPHEFGYLVYNTTCLWCRLLVIFQGIGVVEAAVVQHVVDIFVVVTMEEDMAIMVGDVGVLHPVTHNSWKLHFVKWPAPSNDYPMIRALRMLPRAPQKEGAKLKFSYEMYCTFCS